MLQQCRDDMWRRDRESPLLYCAGDWRRVRGEEMTTYGPFTLAGKDVRPSTAMAVGCPFT